MRVSFSLLSIKALPETVFADIQSIIGFRHSMKKKTFVQDCTFHKTSEFGRKNISSFRNLRDVFVMCLLWCSKMIGSSSKYLNHFTQIAAKSSIYN